MFFSNQVKIKEGKNLKAIGYKQDTTLAQFEIAKELCIKAVLVV